jgi:hypothetical protein
VLRGSTPNTVVSVLITGEQAAFQETAGIARRMKSRPLKFKDLQNLCKSAASLELAKDHFTRIIASRDAPDQGVTLRVYFDEKGFPDSASKPKGSNSIVDIAPDRSDITVDANSSDLVAGNRMPIEDCLSSAIERAFDIEVDLWSRT